MQSLVSVLLLYKDKGLGKLGWVEAMCIHFLNGKGVCYLLMEMNIMNMNYYLQGRIFMSNVLIGLVMHALVAMLYIGGANC